MPFAAFLSYTFIKYFCFKNIIVKCFSLLRKRKGPLRCNPFSRLVIISSAIERASNKGWLMRHYNLSNLICDLKAQRYKIVKILKITELLFDSTSFRAFSSEETRSEIALQTHYRVLMWPNVIGWWRSFGKKLLASTLRRLRVSLSV